MTHQVQEYMTALYSGMVPAGVALPVPPRRDALADAISQLLEMEARWAARHYPDVIAKARAIKAERSPDSNGPVASGKWGPDRTIPRGY